MPSPVVRHAPAGDLRVAWIPGRRSKANPIRALLHGLAMRLGPLTVDELRDELHRWTPAPIARRVVRAHLDALTRRGLLAWSGDRALVPPDIEGRCRREGVRLRWLADSTGRGLSIDAMLCLAFRAERVTDGSLPFAWTDALRWTADRLGIGVDKVTAAERELEAAGILGAGAHPAKRTEDGRERGHRRRSLSGGTGKVRLGPCTNRSQSPDVELGNRIAGDGARRSADPGRALAGMGTVELVADDRGERSGALRAAGVGSLRSPSEEARAEGVRTGTGDHLPRWLVDLERRAAEAHRADAARPDRARLRVLEGLSPVLLRLAPETALDAVLAAAGIYVELRPGRATGPGLRALRRALAARLLAAGFDAREVLALILAALVTRGTAGQRIVVGRSGRHYMRRSRGIAAFGPWFLAAVREAERCPDIPMRERLWSRFSRGDRTPEDWLPARLRDPDTTARRAELRATVRAVVAHARIDELHAEPRERPRTLADALAAAEPAPKVVSRLDVLATHVLMSARARDGEGIIEAVATMRAEGASIAAIAEAVGWPIEHARAVVYEVSRRAVAAARAGSEQPAPAAVDRAEPRKLEVAG